MGAGDLRQRGRARRAAPVAVALAALLAVGVGVGIAVLPAGPAETAVFVPPPLAWAACGEELECGTLEVPLDHADPAGRTVELAVVRRTATAPEARLGVLLYVAGGPGQPGTPAVTEHHLFGESARQRFDLVAWDPRGVSEGTQVDCGADPALRDDLTAIPADEDERAEHERLWRTYVAGCTARAGQLLPHLSTVSSALDVDLLRVALAEEQLSLLGQSYGTAVASVYATLFPERVRAAVLDAAYDLSGSRNRYLAQSYAAGERALTATLQECAEDEFCHFAAGVDPFAAFDLLIERLEAQRARANDKRVGAAEALTAAGYAAGTGQPGRLLAALEEARTAEPWMLRDLADEAAAPGNDLARAVVCLDRPRAHFVVDEETRAAIRRVAPRLGSRDAGGFHPCSVWPLDPEPPPPLTAAGAGPILVVGSTGDVVTPLAASRDLAQRLDRASLLVAEHDGHTSYFSDECVQRAADEFLMDLELPEHGSVCEPARARP
jgi:pimeloyl-ACP methyl ester carboxylesterase